MCVVVVVSDRPTGLLIQKYLGKENIPVRCISCPEECESLAGDTRLFILDFTQFRDHRSMSPENLNRLTGCRSFILLTSMAEIPEIECFVESKTPVLPVTITKPIRMAELLKLVRKMLAESGEIAEAT